MKGMPSDGDDTGCSSNWRRTLRRTRHRRGGDVRVEDGPNGDDAGELNDSTNCCQSNGVKRNHVNRHRNHSCHRHHLFIKKQQIRF